jgi:DnaK suppressor protein
VDKFKINTAYFREKLLELRKELMQIEQTGNEAARTVELDQSRFGRLSRMDALQVQAMSIESKRRRSIKLQRINAALQRIDKDEFGLCLKCGEEIDIKRLEFDPTSPLCIKCAEDKEG